MKRKTKNRLQKKVRTTYAIINRHWADLYIKGDHTPTLEESINALRGLNAVIKSHLRSYELLYPNESNYGTEELEDLDELSGLLEYYSDRWNGWHRIVLLVKAPEIYDKMKVKI